MKNLFIFDLDGTLIDRFTPFGENFIFEKDYRKIESNLFEKLKNKFKNSEMAIISSSCDLSVLKIMQNNFETFFKNFNHLYFENGGVYYQNGIKKILPEPKNKDKIKKLVDSINLNFKESLKTEPSYKEVSFAIHTKPEQTKEHQSIFDFLNANLPDGWIILSAGKHSFELFPSDMTKIAGFDKIISKNNTYNEIYFFGDRMLPGGNDYDLAKHEKVTKAFHVSNYDDTEIILQKIINGIDIHSDDICTGTNAKIF